MEGGAVAPRPHRAVPSRRSPHVEVDVPVVVRWLINAVALYVTALLVPGITLRGIVPTLVAAAVLGIVNALIRPLLLVLTLPINVLTLGLFTLVINAVLLLLTAALVPGFTVRGFWAALLGTIVLSLISFAISHLVRA